MNNKLNIFMLTLRDSFISLLPYVILSSLLILVAEVLLWANVDLSIFGKVSLKDISSILSTFFSFILLISLSYHFAKRYRVEQNMTIILSILIFISVKRILHNENFDMLISYTSNSFLVLFIPILTTYLLKVFTRETSYYSSINTEINLSIKYLFPFFIVYMISIFGYILCFEGLNYVMSFIEFDILFLPEYIAAILYSTVAHLFWFVGISGDKAYEMIVADTNFWQHTALGTMSYSDLGMFVYYGGVGSILALIVAIVIDGKDKHAVKIAKIATPFALFNISEIVIYGLPIVFNRILFLPFIFLPLINMLIVYVVFSIYSLDILNVSTPWITPTLITIYMKTDGNLVALAIYISIFLLNVYLYLPFVKRYTASQSVSLHLEELAKTLDISTSLKSEEGYSLNQAQANIIRSNYALEKVIQLIDNNRLIMYYQPIVNILNKENTNYEALLRLELDNGQIQGPWFLNSIDQAGLSHIIDIWVCYEVKKDLFKWKNKPNISVNIHPNTLNNDNAIEQIIGILEHEKIKFEILEKGLLEHKKMVENIFLLKEKGFEIAIDDLGDGYSNLMMLTNLPIDIVKLDKILIDSIEKEKVYKLIRHIINLCLELNIHCVAEGVETKEQFYLLKNLGVEYIQGYYFSPAIPLADANDFNPY